MDSEDMKEYHEKLGEETGGDRGEVCDVRDRGRPAYWFRGEGPVELADAAAFRAARAHVLAGLWGSGLELDSSAAFVADRADTGSPVQGAWEAMTPEQREKLRIGMRGHGRDFAAPLAERKD